MRLPRLFSDGMVLQQRLPIPVWGWSTPNQAIRVTLAGHGAETIANARGMWMVKLPSMRAETCLGQELDLVVHGDATVTIHDVTIGEVWLCSGQSNMEWPLSCSADAGRQVAETDEPDLRFFTVPHAGATGPQDDVPEGTAWCRSTPASAAAFSAVAWHFGHALHRALNVPIGLIHSSWSGTPAEAWISRAALDSDHALRPILDRVPAMLPTADSAVYRKQIQAWEEAARHQDPGNTGVRRRWHLATHDDQSWSTIELPQPWQRSGLACEGAVWFRRSVTIPAAWKNQELELSLGPIDHVEVVYLDGERIGGVDPEIADPRMLPRFYRIPAAAVKSTTLTIAIRVFNRGGIGGFTGSVDQMWLRPLVETNKPARAEKAKATKAKATTKAKKTVADITVISLAGSWRHQVELALEAKTDVPPPPLHNTHQFVPASLNNAMIQPLVPFAMRGVIWYQGESNTERAEQYHNLLAALIRDWRLAWGQGEFPIGVVQLAGFRAHPTAPGPSTWAELREAQGCASQIPRIGVVTSIDLGDVHDIHPRNKLTVGERLAAWARATIYDQPVPWQGPRFAAVQIDGAKVLVRFNGQQGALTTKDGKPPTAFAIAGRDRKFVWATSKIDGDQVVLSHPKITAPTSIRYAWADHPEVNLIDSVGLPALPFRTDDWPLSTAGQR
jgi:sialate O-acetylesterase